MAGKKADDLSKKIVESMVNQAKRIDDEPHVVDEVDASHSPTFTPSKSKPPISDVWHPVTETPAISNLMDMLDKSRSLKSAPAKPPPISFSNNKKPETTDDRTLAIGSQDAAKAAEALSAEINEGKSIFTQERTIPAKRVAPSVPPPRETLAQTPVEPPPSILPPFSVPSQMSANESFLQKFIVQTPPSLNVIDSQLLKNEHLRIAQNRIVQLENEVEKLRVENDELAGAAEVLNKRSEEFAEASRRAEVQKGHVEESLGQQISLFREKFENKDREAYKFKQKIEELEARLQSDLRKTRHRERELENRLELVKMEKSALVLAKDETILELKRQIDHFQAELENYRKKTVDLNSHYEVNSEKLRRTVRALRLALTNLETQDEGVAFRAKKVD